MSSHLCIGQKFLIDITTNCLEFFIFSFKILTFYPCMLFKKFVIKNIINYFNKIYIFLINKLNI